ncbi:hypothetical protein BD770DRAFT_309575, partial [Pilaira anomala]
QHFDPGLVALSYVISVIGSMTTLELLQRRTHIRGSYNWFLLFASAVSMGGVGIWSMHFIGNNSLTITIEDGSKHQLSYGSGFTFVSLIVAILAMFLAFAFVGITEEAKIIRIIPSGIISGFGIVSMHYLGQVAIDFFVTKNKLSVIVVAIVIAVFAVTVALFIFFKLREQWANQWYKRLGCAMLLSIAASGMHYTALAGTIYYPAQSIEGPPTPLLAARTLIGIIAAIVVPTCIILFIISAKKSLVNNSILFQKKESHRRLILDTVFFDTNGRMLVKVDGIVPMKEILNALPENETHEAFTTSHPLFTRLFETTMQWSSSGKDNSPEEELNNLINYPARTIEYFESVDKAFLSAANQLVEELRFTKLSDLGHLFDSVLSTNTISKKSMFSQDSKKKTKKQRASSISSYLIKSEKKKKKNRSSKSSSVTLTSSTNEDATVIDIFNNPISPCPTTNDNLTVHDSDLEDKHIFLVKKIESNKDLVNLLSIGFRFAEPVFISKTMGERLNIPSDYLLNYFKDMLQMTETAPQAQNRDIRGAVFVGLFTLIEDEEDGDMPYLVVDKEKRYRFPMVQLSIEGDTEAEKYPTELSRLEKSIVLGLSGETLSSMTTVSTSAQKESMDAGYYTGAAKSLISMSSYGKPLASSAKLCSDVIDVPAFSLRSGPCQLILFKSHITRPGTRFAINSTLTESIKCVPFPIYRSFAYHVTDIGVKKYQGETNQQKTSNLYLTQQRVYQNVATRGNQLLDSDDILQAVSSLPPPPRAKRTK